MFELLIAAAVPVVCRVEAALLTCNAPAGYELYALGAEARLLERGTGPARKALAYPLRPGERFVVIAREPAL